LGLEAIGYREGAVPVPGEGLHGPLMPVPGDARLRVAADQAMTLLTTHARAEPERREARDEAWDEAWGEVRGEVRPGM